MTKTDLVNLIAEGTGLTKVETQAVMDGFLAAISFALHNHERVHISGLGSFRTIKRSARMARNPKTNEPVQVPEHYTVVYRPAKDLKKYLNKPRGQDL